MSSLLAGRLVYSRRMSCSVKVLSFFWGASGSAVGASSSFSWA